MEEQVVAITTVQPIAKVWLAYTLNEFEDLRMMGYDSEEEVDQVIEVFKRTGKMDNIFRFLGKNAPAYFEPNMMMKLSATEMHYNLPK